MSVASFSSLQAQRSWCPRLGRTPSSPFSSSATPKGRTKPGPARASRPGLTPEGSPDKKSLVIRGWERAGSWSALFGAGLGGVDFPQHRS
ncbi:protein of unknown function [Methylocella tundrae]|uniref:Uncharacterized protein n=1 Tax=Methylocella tundrae TaxID=227605 RepID=A0A4U8YXW8_METTU|nr:protein of unknown function [Methylocella tundrae]